jgi:hypothetical protein
MAARVDVNNNWVSLAASLTLPIAAAAELVGFANRTSTWRDSYERDARLDKFGAWSLAVASAIPE